MASLLCCYFACEVHTSTSLHFTESSDVKPHLTSLSLSRAQALTHQLGVAEQNPKLNPSSFHQCDPADLSLWRWRGALVRFLGGNLVLGSFHARFCAFSNRFAGTTEALAHSLACGDWMSFLDVMSCRLGAASNRSNHSTQNCVLLEPLTNKMVMGGGPPAKGCKWRLFWVDLGSASKEPVTPDFT